MTGSPWRSVGIRQAQPFSISDGRKLLPKDISSSSYTSAKRHGLFASCVDQLFPLARFTTIFLFQKVFSFPAMLGGLLVSGVFEVRQSLKLDPDVWWHLKVGQDILATHHWPKVDPYSFTVAGQPWLAYEWLGDVLFASVERVGGLRGLHLFTIILGACIIIALYGYGTLRSGNSKAGFLAAAVLLVLAAFNFNLRPQMLGYLFLVLTLIAIERFRQGKPAALWFLPVLFVIWINTHGSWEIGLGTMFLYWVCGLKTFHLGDIEMLAWNPSQRVGISLVFLLCLTAIPITPYGTRLAAYPFEVASSLPLNLAHIDEWRPMPLNLFSPKIFLALVLGTFVVQIISPSKWRLGDMLLFCGGTAMAFIHARFLLIFVPFFTPMFASILARWMPVYEREKDHFVLNAVLMGVMLASMIHYFPSRLTIERDVATQFPVEAVSYLKTHPMSGAMFNSYGFGGYLIYSWGGDGHKVFIDGRGELYERSGVFSDYLRVSWTEPGLLSVLRAYRIEGCLLNREEPLVVFLTALPEWKSVYSDKVSILLLRRDINNDERKTIGNFATPTVWLQ
jgi:hypothetical protein